MYNSINFVIIGLHCDGILDVVATTDLIEADNDVISKATQILQRP